MLTSRFFYTFPVKAETGTDAIFTSAVPSPVYSQATQYCRNLLPEHWKIENTLNHRRDGQIINLRDQTSQDASNVSFKKYDDYASNANLLKRAKLCSFFQIMAKITLSLAKAIKT